MTTENGGLTLKDVVLALECIHDELLKLFTDWEISEEDHEEMKILKDLWNLICNCKKTLGVA